MSKIAIVTGGNSGIGFATAKLLKLKGYNVTIVGRNPERIEAAADALEVDSVIADMGRKEDVEHICEKFSGRAVHALVNNAAIARFAPLAYSTDSDFDEFINVNVRGPLNLIKGLQRSLEKAEGSVTNVSSAIVNNGLANASIYAATKGALDALTKSLAVEFAPFGVRINAVSPGAIDTPIIGKLGLDEQMQAAIKAQVEATIPMARYGNADEVASVILAQLESSYTTGAIWAVDGGVNAM